MGIFEDVIGEQGWEDRTEGDADNSAAEWK
jgi:hypothetical protein